MSYILYKPNKSNTGSACQFNAKFDDECLYAQITKQVAWENNKGLFKGGKRLVSKLNTWEAGHIISAIERNTDWETVHATEKNKTQVKFNRYFKYDSETKTYTDVQLGFSFSLGHKEGDQMQWWRMGINFGESEVLKSYLRWFLSAVYNRQLMRSEMEKAAAPLVKSEKPAEKPVETPQDSEGVEPPADDGSL